MNEKQLNGLLYALQQLQKAMTMNNHKIFGYIAEAIECLNSVLKNNS